MSTLIDFFDGVDVISPAQEALCYEAIWAEINGVRFKDLGERIQKRLPSDACAHIPGPQLKIIREFLDHHETYKFDVLVRETADYPERLRVLDAPLLYYRGDISLLSSPCVSVVGARKASERGKDAARLIASSLSIEGYTIVSGLAAGIDAAAQSQIVYHSSGRTIGVIGTPISNAYPKENLSLQLDIAKKHLLISHVPFYKYSKQDFRINRGFFPERNRIMAALSEATIIVEASDTSGSLIQAREAFKLGKKVVILKPSYDNPRLSWPKTYVKRGAFVAENAGEIKEILGK